MQNLALVVAQLVDQSLPLPEVCGSNLVTGKFNIPKLAAKCIANTEKMRLALTHLYHKIKLDSTETIFCNKYFSVFRSTYFQPGVDVIKIISARHYYATLK